MAANRKSIIASAAALLLAIAAAITPADFSKLDHNDYTYSFKADGHLISVWGKKPECTRMEFILPDGEIYSELPWFMRILIEHNSKKEPVSGEADEIDLINYLKKLASYSNSNGEICEGIDMLDFLRLVSKCNDEKKFRKYANFMIHHAPGKFGPCARKIIESWDEYPKSVLAATNQFFRSGLDLGNEELDDQEMYDKVKAVNLATTKFNVAAMIQVAEEHDGLVTDLRQTLTDLKSQFYPEVNIVNVARGFEAIKEAELTPRFKLVNKYVGFAFQMEHHRHFRAIEKNLKLK